MRGIVQGSIVEYEGHRYQVRGTWRGYFALTSMTTGTDVKGFARDVTLVCPICNHLADEPWSYRDERCADPCHTL